MAEVSLLFQTQDWVEDGPEKGGAPGEGDSRGERAT